MDEFFNIWENNIKIDGVRGTHVFYHISDNHICVADFENDPNNAGHAENKENWWQKMKENFAAQAGERFLPEYRIPSTDMFQRIINKAAMENVEALLLTGDTMEFMHEPGRKFAVKTLTDSGLKFICTPGNHEGESCQGLWSAGIQVMEFDSFWVVAIDNRLKTVKTAVLDKLQKICDEGRPVILMMHIPLVTDNNREAMKKFSSYFTIDEADCDDNAKRLINIIRENSCIKLVLCGHVHGYMKTELLEGVPQICCSQSNIAAIDKIVINA